MRETSRKSGCAKHHQRILRTTGNIHYHKDAISIMKITQKKRGGTQKQQGLPGSAGCAQVTRASSVMQGVTEEHQEVFKDTRVQ